MKKCIAKITHNKRVAPDFCKIRVVSGYLAKTARPGQFVMVRCESAPDTLLRRPLGIHRIYSDGIEMLYEIVGKGTAALSEKRTGEPLDILGPLGNGFETDEALASKSKVTIISGGIGVAPLTALAEDIHKAGQRDITVILGARRKTHILCEDEFRAFGCKVIVSTDDGSMGKKGLVTDILKKRTTHAEGTKDNIIYACGPNPMLKAVWAIAAPLGIPCQFSFEEHMACGVGVCLGCPGKVRPADGSSAFGYKMVCKDGPVFSGEEIVWG